MHMHAYDFKRKGGGFFSGVKSDRLPTSLFTLSTLNFCSVRQEHVGFAKLIFFFDGKPKMTNQILFENFNISKMTIF